MAKFQFMTEEQAENYLRQVERKGKALALPKKRLEKWQEEFERINAYLKENRLAYLFYQVSGKTNRVNMETLERTSAAVRQNGVLKSIHKALEDGNAAEFVRQCEKLRACYLEVVEERMDEWRMMTCRSDTGVIQMQQDFIKQAE